MPPKNEKKKKEEEQDKETINLKKRDYLFRWLKPSRRKGSGGVLPKGASLGRLIK